MYLIYIIHFGVLFNVGLTYILCSKRSTKIFQYRNDIINLILIHLYD